MKDNLIVDLSFDFALDVIKLYKVMISKNEFVVSKQFLKCGTSIGANINEAQAAQSYKDFVSKMTISSKEARETHYWLVLIKKSDIIEFEDKEIIVNDLLDKLENMINILTKIVKTSNIKCSYQN
jgi:four helix bundle protein